MLYDNINNRKLIIIKILIIWSVVIPRFDHNDYYYYYYLNINCLLLIQ